MGIFGTGQALRRREDQRFITGHGQYTDDILLPEQAWLAFARSPYAHGAITSIDVAAARDVPGVLAVYTGEELQRAGVRDVPGAGMPDPRNSRKPIRQPPLARERVRYVGEPVAAVVAESAAIAREAADLIDFDVDELPVVVDPRAARSGPPVHDGIDDNCFGIAAYGDRDATAAAFDKAARSVSVEPGRRPACAGRR
ncbi:MAG: hypothetical protein U5K76_08615 [Woeseiaceae bacterium]|nr:hypothetical protein [Woeseiaceae bacterium]